MEDFKELQNLRFGESTVLIEFCANCAEHNGSLRHDEDKYFQKALEIKTAIQTEFPFFKIFMKPLQTSLKSSVKRLGLLEVYLATYDLKGPRLISSKLKTLVWPDVRVVVNNIRSYFDGKNVRFSLELPKSSSFHPLNCFSSEIKTALVSHYDLPIFQEKLSAEMNSSKRGIKTATANFKKERNISAIVQKKIQSGLMKQQEFEELISSKEYLMEKQLDSDLTVTYINVKPGKYKFIVLGNHNFESISYDVFVEPKLREKDNQKEYTFQLSAKRTCFLTLNVECRPDNPVYKLFYQRLDLSVSENSIESQNEEEFPHPVIKKVDKKDIYSYHVADIFPGTYKIYLEYKDYEVLGEEIQLYVGLNSYTVSYPELALKYSRDEQNSAMKTREVNKEGDRSNEFDGQKTGEGLVTEVKRTKTIQDLRERNCMSPITEKPEAENQRVQNSVSSRTQNKRADNQSDLASKKLSFDESFEDENKENVSQNSSKHSHNYQRQNSKVDKKSQIAKKSLEMDKDSRQFDDEKVAEKANFTKQRVTSGNRIRPGERLYSAKSRNNHQPQLHDEIPKAKYYLFDDMQIPTSDPLKKFFEQNCEQGGLNVFLKINNIFKLEFALHVEDKAIEEKTDDIYKEDVIDNKYEHYFIRSHEIINFVRLFIQRSRASTDEEVDLYLMNNSMGCKIPLTEYCSHMCLDNEEFVDLGLLLRNASKNNYDFLMILAPMSEPIGCHTGVSEIKSIVSFIKNSKYEVWKFFGFEIEDEDESKDHTITAEEALDSLKSYEIYCNSPYIVNAIRFNKRGDLSLKKLNEVYNSWKKFAEFLDKHQIELPDEFGEHDENGEAIELTDEDEIYNDEEDEFQENEDEFEEDNEGSNEEFD
jgi:hypothetical protein